MFGIGATELVIIMVVALLVFGPKRLPELARSLGRGMAEFRRASSDLRQTLQEVDPSESLKPPEPAAGSIAPPASSTDPSEDRDEPSSDTRHADQADQAGRESLPAEKSGRPGEPGEPTQASSDPRASKQADAPPASEDPGARGG